MPPAPLLGAADIVIDQATLDPGVAGRSRNDGVLALPVTLRNKDNTNASKWQWVLETPRESAAVLSSPNSASCQFVPDKPGTYAISLFINEGRSRTQFQKRLLAVKTDAGLRFPAQGEGAEANWTSVFTGAPNETGWWEDLMVLSQATQTAVAGSVLTVDAEVGLPSSRQLIGGDGITVTDNGPGGTLVISSDPLTGVALLADVALSAENLVSTRSVLPATRDLAMRGQVNLGSESDAVSYGTKANYATITGGSDNVASGSYSAVSGGLANSASSLYSTVSGGQNNNASGGAAAIGGGQAHTASGDFATISGGYNNFATMVYATVSGGFQNTASSDFSTVCGGSGHSCGGQYSVICGGVLNLTNGISNGIFAASNSTTDSTYSVVVGGDANYALLDYSATIGGYSNQALGNSSFVAGGFLNVVGGTAGCVIGAESASQGEFSYAIGRSCLANSDYSMAFGRGSSAQHEGACVIKDGTASTVQSTADHELTISYSGGMRLLFPLGRLLKSGYAGSNNYTEEVHSSLSTTDATPFTENLVTIPSGQDCHIRGFIKGKQAGTNAARVRFYEAVYTNNGGTVALVGAPAVNTLNSNGIGSGWAAAVNISGSSIQVAVTGAVAVAVHWTWNFTVSIGGAA